MNSIAFGKYAPFNSFVHRLDPRAKIMMLILVMVAIFLGYSLWTMTFIMAGLSFLLIIGLMIISKVSFLQMLSQLKTLWIMIILLLIINVFVPPTGAHMVAFSLWNYSIYWESIFQSIKIIVRLMLMMSVTMILTSTTKPLDLTYGLEWFMTPLKFIRFPTHEVAMTITIALRFIPTLLDETDRIMKAQASRGVDFEHGGLFNKVRAIISLIVPLFISAFQRSEELANAMEARGYDPKAIRTRYRTLHWSIKDTFSLIFIAVVTTGFILVSVYNLDFLKLIFSLETFIGVIL